VSRCRWWFASPRYNRWVGNVESERVTGASIPDNRSSLARRAVRSFVPGKFRPAVVSLVRPLLYRGNAVHCACCDGDFSRFIPHQGRPYAKCPRCGALERHRLLVSYLRERTDLFAGRLKVLHVAPEWCLQLELRRLSNLDYVSADLDSPLATDHVDLLDLPYSAGSFDVVICNHVLEHVDNDRRALDEIRRVLRADGRAIIMSPIDPASPSTVEGLDVHTPEERRRVYWQRDHLRRYGRDFADRVASRGFSVDTIRYIDQFDATQVQRQGLRRESALFSDDDIFICHCATAA
jgi:SAM-dependent methyltransferase